MAEGVIFVLVSRGQEQENVERGHVYRSRRDVKYGVRPLGANSTATQPRMGIFYLCIV